MKIPSGKKISEKPLIEPKAAESFMKQLSEEEGGKLISLRISVPLLERCNAAAKMASISRSAYVKMAILEKLERDGK